MYKHRHQYNPEETPGILFEGQGKTHQEHREDCDIMTIVSRFRKSGALPFNREEPMYGDFDTGMDFHTAMDRILEAEQSFDRLPSAVRALCENDPGKFLDMLNDEESVKKMQEAGLKFVEPDVTKPATAEGKTSAPAESKTPASAESKSAEKPASAE